MREGNELAQDYNFIDYFFGDRLDPTHARHYLKDDVVFVDLPKEKGEQSIESARRLIDPAILCYLQKRFASIKVLGTDGYEELWTIAD